jgi:hypothetical protein
LTISDCAAVSLLLFRLLFRTIIFVRGFSTTCFSEIMRLEAARADARIKKDKEALGNLLHENFAEINIFGRFSKEQVLNDLFQNVELLEFVMTEERYVDLDESAVGLAYRVREKLKTGDAVQSFECFMSRPVQAWQRQVVVIGVADHAPSGIE